jgi:tRNA pseudouridine synthase 10
MECEFINGRFFILKMTTSAGMYVKEFVHGDLGRTQPNVGSLLGCEADILQLDVLSLIMKQ